MEFLTPLVSLITALVALGAAITPIIISVSKTAEGVKCLLRSEMLRIYYRSQDDKRLRQYEYENFVALYEAYKKLHGNLFIDKIYDDVKKWEIIS